jgi:uncharacterized protein involved in exopolysaccharide biosynthesis
MSLLPPSPNSYTNSQLNAGHGVAPILEGVPVAPTRTPTQRLSYDSPAIPAEPPALNFQILRSLRMHGRRAFFIGLGVAAALFCIGLMLPKLYTAQSLIYVEPIAARSLNEIGSPNFDQFRYASYLDQQMQTVVRPDILASALKSLPVGTWQLPNESEEDAIKRLARKLVVERQLTSYQIAIKLSDANPQTSAAVVTAVTNAYLKGGRKDETTRADGRLQLLGEERQRVRNELEADRKEEATLGSSIGVANPVQSTGNPFDTSTANIRSQLQTARQARDVAQAQLESVSGTNPDHRSGLAAAADESILTDPGLSALKTSANNRRVALQTAMAGLTPNNPQYKQYQDELADIDRSVEAKTAEVRNRAEIRIQDKLRTELQRTAEVEGKLNSQLAAETAKATGAGPKFQRAQELEADITRLNSLYTTIDTAYNALEIETNGPSMAHQVGTVTVPVSPDPGKNILFMMAALPFGLLVGFSSAVILRVRDGRIYLGSDIQHAAGFAPMAVLPDRTEVSTPVADEYVLRLAAGIESAYRTAGAQSFILTAVSSDTAVSPLIADLTRKLEDLRLKVRVVHAADLLTTSQETMEHKAATADLALATPRAEPAGEGIASSKLDRMKQQADLILIESAPILHSAETEYAARCADATILVVESGVTLSAQLIEATTLLSRLRVSGVATVLDQLRLENADSTFRTSIRVIERRNREEVSGRKPQPSAKSRGQSQPDNTATPTRPAPAVAAVPSVQPTQTLQPAQTPAVAAKPQAAPIAPQAPRVAQANAPSLSPTTSPVAPVAPKVSSIVAPIAASPVAETPIRRPARVGYHPDPEPATTARTSPAIRPVSQPTPSPINKIINKAIEPWPEKATPLMPLPVQSIPAPPIPAKSNPPQILAPEPVIPTQPVVAQIANELHVRSAAELAAAMNPARKAALKLNPEQSAQPKDAPAISSASPAAAKTAPNQHIKPLHLPISAVPTLRPTITEPGQPVGGMITESDQIAPVPAYTQSQIRRAFKEQEVNSKTKWFSKLFRGDSPSKLNLLSEEDDPFSSLDPAVRSRFDPIARPQESALKNDPEVQNLLDRIKPRGELQPIQRVPRPVRAAVAESPKAADSPWNGLIDRRREPRAEEHDAEPQPTAQTHQNEADSGYLPAPTFEHSQATPSGETPVSPFSFQQVAEVASSSQPDDQVGLHPLVQSPSAPVDEPAQPAFSSHWAAPVAQPVSEPVAPLATPSRWSSGQWQTPPVAEVENQPEAHAVETDTDSEPDYSEIWAKHFNKPAAPAVNPEEEAYTLNALGKRVAIFTAPTPSQTISASHTPAVQPTSEWTRPEQPLHWEPAPKPEAEHAFTPAEAAAPTWPASAEPVASPPEPVWRVSPDTTPVPEPPIAFPEASQPIQWGRPSIAPPTTPGPLPPVSTPVEFARSISEPIPAIPEPTPEPIPEAFPEPTLLSQVHSFAPAAPQLEPPAPAPRRWALLSKFDPESQSAHDNES